MTFISKLHSLAYDILSKQRTYSLKSLTKGHCFSLVPRACPVKDIGFAKSVACCFALEEDTGKEISGLTIVAKTRCCLASSSVDTLENKIDYIPFYANFLNREKKV